MTDREPLIPTDPNRPPSPQQRATPLAVDPNTHLESAPRGDGLPMSLILAPRPHSRPAPPEEHSVDPVRAWLTRVSAPIPDLPGFAPIILPPANHRCAAEVDAAARAAGCPDLFVIHAPDPAIRERVISDVVWAVADDCQNPRTLVLSPDPIAADRVVERLVKADVRVVRALADDENPARPSPVVARATSVALGATRAGQLKQNALAAIAAATDRINAIATAISTLPRLAELGERESTLHREMAVLTARRDQTERQVQSEATGVEVTAFTTLLDKRREEGQTATSSILEQRIAAQEAHKEKETTLATLRQQRAEVCADSAKKPGFFARLLGKPKHAPEPAELEKQLHEAERASEELAARVVSLKAELDATAVMLAAEREKLIQDEIASRRHEFDSRLAEMTADRVRLRTEIDAAIHSLGSNPQTANELADAHAAAERDLVAARQRAIELDGNTEELIRGFLAESRVVVGTPGSLEADPVFHHDPHQPTHEHPFGLLVLDRAEELTEGDFVRLARLAGRWILIGKATIPEEPKTHLNGAYPRHSPGSGRNGRSLDGPFVSRLARSLDRETWVHESDRLVCRLMHLTPDQRRGMTREPLLDRPEIELRFATHPSGEPLLVEFAFPLATTVASAKSFLYHQLGEVLLRPCGAVTWHNSPTTIDACWASAEQGAAPTDATWIDLAPGVREKVAGTGCAAFTAAITFDPVLGWDAPKAEAWLNEHLPIESVSRYAVVTR